MIQPSNDPVSTIMPGADIVPAPVMEKVEEVKTFLAGLPASVMLEVVGAVVSAHIEVTRFYLMS